MTLPPWYWNRWGAAWEREVFDGPIAVVTSIRLVRRDCTPKQLSSMPRVGWTWVVWPKKDTAERRGWARTLLGAQRQATKAMRKRWS